MQRRNVLALSILPLLLLTSCFNRSSYVDKKVNVYRKPNEVDKQITLRYFSDQPNVPYIQVQDYFLEFFNTFLFQKIDGKSRTFLLAENYYLGFDSEKQLFFSKGLMAFNHHPDFIQSNAQIFLKNTNNEVTTPTEKVVNLKNYSIKIYNDYVPLSFLSKVSGGMSQYDIAYNGKDIYVIDYGGQLGTATNPSAYGDEYLSVLNDNSQVRYEDLAKYNYHELCFVFDNLRGYTNQLVFGDNNLLSLGLNGLLERYAPKVKEYLLSSDRANYYEGLNALFCGLFDGGHTGILGKNFDAFRNAVNRKSEQTFVDLSSKVEALSKDKTSASASARDSRRSVFGSVGKNYYKFDTTTKTAYIGFDGFVVDYNGWDNYYKNSGSIPVETDTYAHVRDKFYKALTDNAENVVLDLTTNGGGSSHALEGVVGLLNKGKSSFYSNDVFNKYRITENYLIDVNLDGKYDEIDAQEAEKFNFNIGILTSRYSFSCANLFPSILKELGYKIIGEQSGGGSCAISIDSTADGILYVHSSYLCLSDRTGSSIDSGVPVDFAIEHPKIGQTLEDYSKFYNFEIVSEYLSSAYNLS